MNKRIKELAERAETKEIGYYFFDREKFAELIIKECSKIADLADENKCEWIGGNILTHFGINND